MVERYLPHYNAPDVSTDFSSTKFNEFKVKEWLGDAKVQTTMGYIKDAKRYYNKAPYDWIYRVLKALHNGGDNT